MATGITKSLDEEADTVTAQIVTTGGAGVAQGETITFSATDPGLSPGDRISFGLTKKKGGGWNGTNLTLDSAGTHIGSNTTQNITVNASDTYLIDSGATMTGTITMNGGMISISGGSTVTGVITGTAEFFVIEDNSSMNGGSDLTGTGTSTCFMSVNECTAGGNVVSDSWKTAEVLNSTISGNVDSNNDTNITIMSNTVSGNLTITNATSCKELNNTVSGTNSGCPGDKG